MSAVGRWTAPGMCPWSQHSVERESRITNSGSPPAVSAVATSDTSAGKSSEAGKWAAASADAAGATRRTGFGTVVVMKGTFPDAGLHGSAAGYDLESTGRNRHPEGLIHGR